MSETMQEERPAHSVLYGSAQLQWPLMHLAILAAEGTVQARVAPISNRNKARGGDLFAITQSQREEQGLDIV